MTTPKMNLDTYDTHLRERLRLLVTRFSQAEVARRTGTPRGKVNRYLHGTRISGDFLSALVDGLGVNPAWLLSGEGAPFLSDVTPINQGGASDLLGLVQALNNVSRSKLGALLKGEGTNDLRVLNNQLREHRSLTHQLADMTKPLFNDLIVKTSDAIARNEMEQAVANEAALLHLEELCKDDNCHLSLLSCRQLLENWRGNTDKSLELAKQVFFARAARPETSSEGLCRVAQNYAVLLRKDGQLEEAARVLRAIIEYVSPEGDAYWLVNATLGLTLSQLGRVRESMPWVRRAIPRLKDAKRKRYAEACFVYLSLFSGSLSFEHVGPMAQTNDEWAFLTSFYALWNEGREALLLSNRINAKSPLMDASPQYRILKRWVVAMESNISKPSTRIREDFEQKSKANYSALQNEIERFEYDVALAQISLACDDHKQAVTHTLNAQKRLKSMGPIRTPQTIMLALHNRTILRLAGRKRASVKVKEFVEHAYVFFESAVEGGYAIFESHISPHTDI